MKRRFKVTIEGESYEVEVEEIAEARPKVPTATVKAPPVTPEAPPPVTPAVTKPPVTKIAAEGVVTAPMPGTVISIKVKVGDLVKAGDALLILESMKIQNEIPASRDGKIKEIHVSEGKSVKRMEPLITIEG